MLKTRLICICIFVLCKSTS